MKFLLLIRAPNLEFSWMEHGFGLRDSAPVPDLATVRQVHSARVLDACGRKGGQIGEGDAIISSEPGVAIGIGTADCVPLLLADPAHRVVACIHAGWRGTAANIVGETVEAMRARGCQAGDLHVAIGPSIGSCCYAVGVEVADRFRQWRPNDGSTTLDLPAINEIQLRIAGVREIWKSGECTYCDSARFFSFRREKDQAGRMLSFVSRLV